MRQIIASLFTATILFSVVCFTSCRMDIDNTPTSYSVSIQSGISNGKIVASTLSAEAGSSVSLTVTPNTGYQLKAGSLTVMQGATSITISGSGLSFNFIMPAGNVVINCEFEDSGIFIVTEYSVNIANNLTNGTIVTNKTSATAGTSVIINITPNNGYQLKAGTVSVLQGSNSIATTQYGTAYTFSMPVGDVIVSCEFEELPPNTYTIAIESNITNGILSANATSAVAGTVVSLTITPNSGYQLQAGTLTVVQGATNIPVTGSGVTYSFTMPSGNVSISCNFEAINYSINIDQGITNGSVVSNLSSATVGTTVILTVSPNTGYQLQNGTLLVKQGSEFVSTINNGNTYLFTMPANNVDVICSFENILYDIGVSIV